MKSTWSFELLTTANNKRLFAAHWSSDNIKWAANLSYGDYVCFSDVGMPSDNQNHMIELIEQYPYPENLIFLSNDIIIHESRLKLGIKSVFINQNAFIDENIFTILNPDTNIKEYDVIYNARLRPVKRHNLARKVGENLRLALIVGHHTPGLSSIDSKDIPKNVYMNNFQLQPSSVAKLLNKARVGMILSEAEGACFSSSEYLLCGLPVISTRSRGGRDFWYDEGNSIICDSNEDSVYLAAQEALDRRFSPYSIREAHIKKMYAHRQKFIDEVLIQFFGCDKEMYDINEFYSSFNFKRFLVFQQKYSWKTLEEINNFLINNISIGEKDLFLQAFEF